MSTPPGPSAPAGPSWGFRVVVTAVAVAVSLSLGALSGVVAVRAGGGGGAPEPGPSQSPVASRPSDSVRRYLEALAAADSAAALAETLAQPADRTLLGDEVLRASQQLAPLSAITVPDTTGASSRVEASYRIGEEQVTTVFSVEEVPGGYKLAEGVTTVDVKNLRSEQLPLLVAGVEVKGNSVTLFPGAYEVSSGNEYVVHGDGELLVTKPDDYPSTSDLRAELAEPGRELFTELVEEELAKCLESSSPKPKGCPFEAYVSASHEIKKDSGSWEMAEDALTGLDPQLDYEDPTRATEYVSAELTYTYRYTSDYEDGEQDGTASAYMGQEYVLDLASDPPELGTG